MRNNRKDFIIIKTKMIVNRKEMIKSVLPKGWTFRKWGNKWIITEIEGDEIIRHNPKTTQKAFTFLESAKKRLAKSKK